MRAPFHLLGRLLFCRVGRQLGISLIAVLIATGTAERSIAQPPSSASLSITVGSSAGANCNAGVRVKDLERSGRDATFDMKVGDEIISMNGTQIVALEKLQSIMDDLEVDSDITVELRRAGRTHSVKFEYSQLVVSFKRETAADAQAMLVLARKYKNQTGKCDGGSQALIWYERAAAAGSSKAMSELARIYEIGDGIVSRDMAKATQWYEKAASNGDTKSMTRLAEINRYGRGGPVDVDRSLSWYKKAAGSGDTDAMFELGTIFKTGDGVSRNTSEAKVWYLKGAQSGHDRAMYEVAMIDLTEENGSDASAKRAARWMRQSAEKGNARAMAVYGILLENGVGVGLDTQAASTWFERANKNGVSRSSGFLAGLRGRIAGMSKKARAAREKTRKEKVRTNCRERWGSRYSHVEFKPDGSSTCFYNLTRKQMRKNCRKKWGSRLSYVKFGKNGNYTCIYKLSRKQMVRNCRKRWGRRYVRTKVHKKGYTCIYRRRR